MSRLSPSFARRTGAWLAAGATAASAGAGLVEMNPGSDAGWWLAALAALVVMVVVVVALRRERRLAARLQAARVEAQGLADVLDVWQWRSDGAHRLVQWRPPRGAPAGAWSAEGAPQPLWARFRCEGDSALRSVAEAHAPIEDLDVQVQLPDGTTVHCQLRGTALTDTQGRFSGYIGTARVTGTVVPAQAPAPAPAPAPARAEVQLPDSEQESFSYTVSHDLRAPIRVVEGFTKILKEDYGRLLDRIGNDHLDRVLGAAARMNSMIDALLALSQLSTQPIARQPVNLSQLARYVADDLHRQSPDRQAHIVIEPDLQVQGDPTLLRVVLENLLGNAWKYTGKCRQPQIWFGHDPGQPAGTFTVRDNGAGFDMRFADRLFGVFQRLHSAADFQGTGIGLASVRRIVRRHGGDIWAEAEVDRGASFHFTLR
ncbi:MAG TPA: ATP-binding protein [Albitalea sp.]|nr:ATP-binding protein [Albitalea sp.]